MKPKRTILCVDEDERSLSIQKVMLETRGYRVVACSTRDHAVSAMQSGGIDLVLADLPIPKPDGSPLVDELKAISPTTPAIVFKSAAVAYPEALMADLLLSKSSCSASQLLDHIRIALIRKRGPKPAALRGPLHSQISSYQAGKAL
jgi:CheY-like chemotaxis protein